MEDVNPGTVTLNLNAVVRNPTHHAKKQEYLKNHKTSLKYKNHIFENKQNNSNKFNKDSSIICHNSESDSSFKNKYFNNRLTDSLNNLHIKNNINFAYKPKKFKFKKYPTKKSFKNKKKMYSSTLKEANYQSPSRMYEHKYSIQEDSRENSIPKQIKKSKTNYQVKDQETYSIEPQISKSKMPPKSKIFHNHFYKPIPSTMSIKSSNPIIRKLNKKLKSKNQNDTKLLREIYGLEEEQHLNSNKSVKFSHKNSVRSKRDLFNISDSKSRLSNFSADLFPSNSNFTYDVNKIKQKLRTKNEIYKKQDLNDPKLQDHTRSQSKLQKKNSLMIQRDFQKYDIQEQSDEDFNLQTKHNKFNPQYQKVIYNTNQVTNHQLNIINMTLSVHGEKHMNQNTKQAKKFNISRKHNDSYSYTKNSLDR